MSKKEKRNKDFIFGIQHKEWCPLSSFQIKEGILKEKSVSRVKGTKPAEVQLRSEMG